ncbi:MAG: GGDEF domain-containing protein [Eubacterium sp.]|nr:GGDEF domain-containing protein [Eubacterium sp.]
MRSFRTKLTLLTVIVVILAVSFVSATSKKALAFFRERPVLTAGILVSLLALLLFLLIRNTLMLKRAKQNKELITATETDPLTGLYITNYFWEYANRIFFENPDLHMDAIVVNISRFHSVNAINGRLFGDNVLRSIGDEITLFINENGGIAGYMGSDQFSIFTPHLEDCRSLFNRLQGKLDTLSAGSNIKLRMGVMQWEENTEPQQLMEHALVACNLARNYKEQLVIFDENMRRSEAFEQQLLSDLNRAAENGELTVHYQPQFNIRENPPKLIGAEALVRWNHPKYGLISSSDFIPIFERNGQISIIDNFVWRQTARQAAEWLKKYGSLFPISINLSRIDIFDSALEKTLDEMHSENGLPIGAIDLEVTESAYTENSDKLIEIIERLRSKGYKVQMDDFGSGYSSLNMLADMPVDALKMDKAFITDINSNPKRIQLIELILHIAESLNIPVIAEGIENEEQLLLLQNLGCDMAQGFYFSKALPPERFEKEILQKQKEN